jgi:predicted PurR-regulated permease PerM
LIAIPSLLAPVAVRQAQALSDDFNNIRIQVENFFDRPLTIAGQSFYFGQVVVDLLESTGETTSPLAERAFTILESTSLGVIWLLIILVGGYYFLLDWEHLRKWFIRLAPESAQADIQRLIEEINIIWQAYLYGTFLLMIIVGIVFTIVWAAIGLPGAVVLGLLMGFLTIIPDVGPTIGAILAMVVAFFQGSNFLPMSNLSFTVLVFVLYLALIQIKAIWLRPRIMGRLLHLNEGVVFVAIIGATVLWGILGALIIVPMLATLGVIGRYIRCRLLQLDPWPDSEEAAPPLSTEAEPPPKSVEMSTEPG